jgi:hypothetical protein
VKSKDRLASFCFCLSPYMMNTSYMERRSTVGTHSNGKVSQLLGLRKGGNFLLNATFNNISVISWWSVLLVEETWVPGEITDLPQFTDKHYHITLYHVHPAMSSTDCIGSCKSNYHMITTPLLIKSYFPWTQLHYISCSFVVYFIVQYVAYFTILWYGLIYFVD